MVELVRDLGRKYGTSMLFISHNLGLVLDTCDRICVMYSGEAVERGALPMPPATANPILPLAVAWLNAVPWRGKR